MNRFKRGQRVHVLYDDDGDEIGINGTVCRLRMADNGAWITLDKRHDKCPFPEDDASGRGTHIMSFPDFCEKERA
jgi:hypothetical protein